MGSYPKLKKKKKRKNLGRRNLQTCEDTAAAVGLRPALPVAVQCLGVSLSLSESIVNELELNVDCTITHTPPHTKKKKGKTEIPIFLELCGTVLGFRISQRPELAALKKPLVC